ncbi:MAG: hypothetical protein WC048_04240 [Rhizobium sp.]
MTDPIDPADKATVAEVARIRAILTGDAGKQLPELARTIAFSTRLSPDGAAALFDAVLIDFDAVLPSSSPSVPAALSYADHNRRAGALGTTPFAPETSAHGNGGGDE